MTGELFGPGARELQDELETRPLADDSGTGVVTTAPDRDAGSPDRWASST